MKKWILFCLCPLVAALGWLSFSIGGQELNLPLSVQLSELRLTEPSRLAFDVGANHNSTAVARTVEYKVAGYSECRQRRLEVIANSKSADQPTDCSDFLRRALEQAPSDGRLWLEYARELMRDGGIGPTALAALRRSFLLSPHEGWIVNARVAFVLPIWTGLPSDIRETARSEIEERLSQYSFVAMLARSYLQNPLARKAISEVLQDATPSVQRQFLDRLKQ